MTETYNVYAAKTHLSQLLDRVAKGEEIVIAKAGKPLGKLTPFHAPVARRMPARQKGRPWIASDAFSPETDAEIADDFYNSEIVPVEDEVVVTKLGKPVARFVLTGVTKPGRIPGRGKNKGWIADDFNAPLPKEILDSFYGSVKPRRPHRKKNK